jgi:hypothetical protein
MLAPQLHANPDLEESVNDSPSDIVEATPVGNLATVKMLLDARAKILGEFSALNVIFERWKSF